MNGVPVSPTQRNRVEAFRRKHRVGVLTLFFSDMVGFARLKQELGDTRAHELVEAHHAAVREILAKYPEGEEIDTAGDAFFIVFAKPSDALRFSLELQAANRRLSQTTPRPIQDRIGVHAGEVVITEAPAEKDLFGLQVDTAARIMGLGDGDQVLMSRFVFDNARQALKGQDLAGLGPLAWLSHGDYVLKGVDEPMEVCEVGETGLAVLKAPGDSEKAHRHAGAGELVLGWRPAVGQKVPGTQWILDEKLGEGGFGEAWVGTHERLKEKRVFKFCFRADRVRSLKREVTLFRILKERTGTHPHIASVLDVYLDQPPYYLEMEYVPGRDLRQWCEHHGGVAGLPLDLKIELIVQAAEGLQAAHDAGIIHRDVKPTNLLVADGPDGKPVVKLTDFGVGHVTQREVLGQMTQMGFTGTLMGSGSGTGTQLYMAPELVAGKPSTVRSDLYALGVVLFQLVTGGFETPVTTDWWRHIEDPLLREDLELCFAGNPEERFGSAAELARRLHSLSERRQTAQRAAQEAKALEQAAYRKGLRRSALGGIFLAAVLVVIVSHSIWRAAWVESLGRKEYSAVAARLNQTSANLNQISSGYRDLVEKQQVLSAQLTRTMLKSPVSSDQFARELRDLLAFSRIEPSSTPIARLSYCLLNVNWHSALSETNLQAAIAGLDRTSGPWLQHGSDIVHATFSPDAEQVATASKDHTARLWNVETGQSEGSPMVHEGSVRWVEFSQDGRWLATASDDATVRIWDAVTGKSLLTPFVHTNRVVRVCLAPDRSRLATVTADFQLYLWGTRNPGDPAIHCETACATLHAVFDRTSKYLVTTCEEAHQHLWDANSGREMTTRGRYQHTPQIALATTNPPVRQGCAEHLGRCVLSPHPHESSLPAQLSRDGRFLLSAPSDSSIQIYDTETGVAVGKPLQHTESIWYAAFSPDGERVVTKMGTSAFLWAAKSGELIAELPQDPSWEAITVCFSPDSRYIVTICRDCSVRFWDAVTGLRTGPTLGRLSPSPTPGFTPDGHRLVLTSPDNTALIWDLRAGRSVGDPLEHPGRVLFARFSPGGRSLITVSGNVVVLWDALTGTKIRELLREEGAISFATLSGDGAKMLLEVTPNWVRVWDMYAGKPLSTLLPCEHKVIRPVFAPDGRRFLTANDRRSIQVWDAETIRRIGEPIQLGGRVLSAEFSPDGQHLLTTSEGANDRQDWAEIWPIQPGWRSEGPLYRQPGVFAAHFSTDGQRVVATTRGSAFVSEIPTGWTSHLPLPPECVTYRAAVRAETGLELLPVCCLGLPQTPLDSVDTLGPLQNHYVASWGSNEWCAAEISTGLPITDRFSASFAALSETGEHMLVCYGNSARLVRLRFPFLYFSDVLSLGRSLIEGAAVSSDLAPLVEWLRSDPQSRSLRDLRQRAQGCWERGVVAKATPTHFDFDRARPLYPTNHAIPLAMTAASLAATGSGQAAAIAYIKAFKACTDSEVSKRLVTNLAKVWIPQLNLAQQATNVELALAAVGRVPNLERNDLSVWHPSDRSAMQAAPADRAAAVYGTFARLLAANDKTNRSLAREAFLAQIRLLSLLGRSEEVEAARVGVALAPRRPAGLRPSEIDLSMHYNHGLDEDSVTGAAGNHLGRLPTGLVILAGSRFDVRAMIQLASPALDTNVIGLPERVDGMRVAQKARRIRLLHGTGMQEENGASIARLVVHYTSGEMRDLPIQYGLHVRDWWHGDPGDPKDEVPGSVVAWTGQNAVTDGWNGDGKRTELRLFKTTFENPLPDVEITTLDYVSTMSKSAPFVIAITVEP